MQQEDKEVVDRTWPSLYQQQLLRYPIHTLLMEFGDLFATPSTLPPPRFLDHSIHLKPNSEPINHRAYDIPLSKNRETDQGNAM